MGELETTFQLKKFEDFAVDTLYEVLELRSKIFVVEQDCVYQDLDGKDQKAIHLLMYLRQKLIGYARIFKPGDYFDEAAMGRVVVDTEYRKGGIGTLLVNKAIAETLALFAPPTIRISAQQHLMGFYQNCGFQPFGDEYLEDGIPHIAMRYYHR